jgi:hypothetical protein
MKDNPCLMCNFSMSSLTGSRSCFRPDGKCIKAIEPMGKSREEICDMFIEEEQVMPATSITKFLKSIGRNNIHWAEKPYTHSRNIMKVVGNSADKSLQVQKKMEVIYNEINTIYSNMLSTKNDENHQITFLMMLTILEAIRFILKRMREE